LSSLDIMKKLSPIVIPDNIKLLLICSQIT